jgi:hypothetical protein
MILRIYADAEGESHFEDVELASSQPTSFLPLPPVLMTAPQDASSYGFELVHPRWQATGTC